MPNIQIWTLILDGRYGTDVTAHATLEDADAAAWAEIDEMADDDEDRAFIAKCKADGEMGEAWRYFNKGEGFVTTEQCEVELPQSSERAALDRIAARLRGEWHDPTGDLESDIASVLREALGEAADEPKPAPVVLTPEAMELVRWAAGMADEAIMARESGDDPDDTEDVMSLHREMADKLGAWLDAAAPMVSTATARAVEHIHNLLGELEYVHETGNVPDSLRNAPQHMEAARAFILELEGEG